MSEVSLAEANPVKSSLLKISFRYLAGIGLCVAVALASFALQIVEVRLFGHPYVEALVIAILLGMAVRTLWQPAQLWRNGIAFSAKQLLEVAVMLLGASVSFAAIAASGALLIGLIIAIVVVMLAVSFLIMTRAGLSGCRS